MFAGAGLSQAVWDHLDRHAEAAIGERICVFTGLGMTETAPSCTFALGSDVPPLAGQPLFPAVLAELDEPLERFLARWDRTQGRGVGSGARDWEELGERMTFIATLFRSRQQHRRLLDEPFGPEQRSALARGVVPEGPL